MHNLGLLLAICLGILAASGALCVLTFVLIPRARYGLVNELFELNLVKALDPQVVAVASDCAGRSTRTLFLYVATRYDAPDVSHLVVAPDGASAVMTMPQAEGASVWFVSCYPEPYLPIETVSGGRIALLPAWLSWAGQKCMHGVRAGTPGFDRHATP